MGTVPPRLMALSEQLIRVHQALRERLASLRSDTTAVLESHFSFEERRIAAALDTLGPENQFPAVFTSHLQFPT